MKIENSILLIFFANTHLISHINYKINKKEFFGIID